MTIVSLVKLMKMNNSLYKKYLLTIQEIFTNYPHGLERAFIDESTYFVVTDQQGFKSIVYENIYQIIESGIYNDTPETQFNLRLINDLKNLDVFWVNVELDQQLWGYYSNTPLPDNIENRKKIVAEIQNEFLSKLPDEKVLQYKLDPYHPSVYLQLNEKGTVLYMQAEQGELNIDRIGLYYGEGDPVVSQ